MITELKNGYVKHEVKNHICTIEFYHPQSNSLPGRILEELAHTIHAAGLDPNVRVIVLQSGGDRAFCAGASFDELQQIENEQQGIKFFTGFAHVINAMRKSHKFVIGRVQGKCVGGGLGLVAACDYAIAAEGADIKLSELSVGIGPFVIGPAVERKIGVSAFSQLAIDASMWRNADWARRKGLYAELHPTVEGMDESIHRLATTLSHRSPAAMEEIKRMMWEGTAHWDEMLKQRAALSGRLVLGAFAKDAIAEFKAKSLAKK